MQNYYHMAITNNLATKRALWAILYHVASTDDHPQHQYCPDAPQTWCKWKKKKAGDKTCENFVHKKEKTIPKAIVES